MPVLTSIFGLILVLAGLIHLLGGFRLGKCYDRRWLFGGHLTQTSLSSEIVSLHNTTYMANLDEKLALLQKDNEDIKNRFNILMQPLLDDRRSK